MKEVVKKEETGITNFDPTLFDGFESVDPSDFELPRLVVVQKNTSIEVPDSKPGDVINAQEKVVVVSSGSSMQFVLLHHFKTWDTYDTQSDPPKLMKSIPHTKDTSEMQWSKTGKEKTQCVPTLLILDVGALELGQEKVYRLKLKAGALPEWRTLFSAVKMGIAAKKVPTSLVFALSTHEKENDAKRKYWAPIFRPVFNNGVQEVLKGALLEKAVQWALTIKANQSAFVRTIDNTTEDAPF